PRHVRRQVVGVLTQRRLQRLAQPLRHRRPPLPPPSYDPAAAPACPAPPAPVACAPEALMSDLAGLLDDIREHPDDDGPRLVCADWFDDHGQHDRAEFIRRQCEYERAPEYECDP